VDVQRELGQGPAADQVVRIPEAERPGRPASVRAAYRRLGWLLAVSDVLAVALALLIAYWVRFDIRVPSRDFLSLLLGTPFVVVAVFGSLHLYEAYRYTPAEEFRRLIWAVTIGVGGLMVLSFWSKADLSRSWVGLSWGFALMLALIERRLWHAWMGRQKIRGRLSFPTVIVGTNAEARRLASALARGMFGYRPLAMVTTDELPPGRSVRVGDDLDLPIAGDVGNIREAIRATNAECVFVASTAVSPEQLEPVAKAVRLEDVEVRITASLPEVLASRLTVQPLAGLTALSLRPAKLSGTQIVAKFTFDILASMALLILLSPLILGIAVAIKLDSRGPVLFRQRRIGLRGRSFTMLKFRTMRDGAEGEIERLRAETGVEDVMFKLPADPRVTKVGRWLRRSSLDELPQLLNVVKGDMSLVGPRPALPEEVMRYADWQVDRLQVPPGMTGLWQISGRADLPFDDSVRLDVFYIENWSLAYDLYILSKTILVLLSHRGAY
jgi:exopolysaccharide biosynthesis polyprenyl glycosylphosphotransferase